MTYTITLSPSGHQFSCEDDQELLKAGLEAGFLIPFSCRSGMCLTCRGKVLHGEVDHGDSHVKYLSLEDRANGLLLLCSARPRSDLHLQIEETDPNHGNLAKKLPARVIDIKTPAADIKILTLGLPANEPMHFRAGQFIDILVEGGNRRSYSIASVPKAAGVRQIELHIRHLPGGLFTDFVFDRLKLRDILQIEMPLGNCFLREDSKKPMIALASGTGFAPIKSMLQYCVDRHLQRSIHLYWGCRQLADLYELEWVKAFVREHSQIDFIPVLSDALDSDHWSGRTGLVHQFVMQDHPNLLGYEVYACGSPLMVESAREDFSHHCQLKPGDFHADSFISQADLVRLKA
jgi:CDP-4-dehydro-6-deoxyglucose reductase